MARKRASMREGPLAELFRKTEAAQRGQEPEPHAPKEQDEAPAAETDPRAVVAFEETVEHVPDFAKPAEPEPASTAAAPAAPETMEPVKPEPIPIPSPAPATSAPEESAEAAASRATARYFQTILEPAPRLHRVPPP
jgi:hypothetical protein